MAREKTKSTYNFSLRPEVKEALGKLAELNVRSESQQVEYLIIEAAKSAGIKMEARDNA